MTYRTQVLETQLQSTVIESSILSETLFWLFVVEIHHFTEKSKTFDPGQPSRRDQIFCQIHWKGAIMRVEKDYV
jgi:hypothetical protein